jgi:hypothetical protein
MRQNEVIVFPNLQPRQLKSNPVSLKVTPSFKKLPRQLKSNPVSYTRIQMNYIKREVGWCLGLGLGIQGFFLE